MRGVVYIIKKQPHTKGLTTTMNHQVFFIFLLYYKTFYFYVIYFYTYLFFYFIAYLMWHHFTLLISSVESFTKKIINNSGVSQPKRFGNHIITIEIVGNLYVYLIFFLDCGGNKPEYCVPSLIYYRKGVLKFWTSRDGNRGGDCAESSTQLATSTTFFYVRCQHVWCQ